MQGCMHTHKCTCTCTWKIMTIHPLWTATDTRCTRHGHTHIHTHLCMQGCIHIFHLAVAVPLPQCSRQAEGGGELRGHCSWWILHQLSSVPAAAPSMMLHSWRPPWHTPQYRWRMEGAGCLPHHRGWSSSYRGFWRAAPGSILCPVIYPLWEWHLVVPSQGQPDCLGVWEWRHYWAQMLEYCHKIPDLPGRLHKYQICRGRRIHLYQLVPLLTVLCLGY